MQDDKVGVDSRVAFKYWAFISYSHADAAWSTWLHRALEGYRVPRPLVGRDTPGGKVPRRVYPIFRDRDELPGASSLTEAVAHSLSQSRFLIVVCSPRAAASRYVNEEIHIFKRLGRAERVLCLIVDGEPGATARPDSGLLEAFPPALRQQTDSNGALANVAMEPLAADVRPGKDGKQNAKLKLLAGMLGVGYDELKRRERRRQRWRVALTAASMLLVVGITAGIWLNRQRVVEEQRIRAEAGDLATKAVTDKESGRRLSLAMQSVRLTRDRYGYVQPESEIALYRALADAGLRGFFVENDTTDTFGGWTWPVAISRDGTRILAPSALGPTLLLDADAEKRGLLVDRETPYEHDLAAIASSDGKQFITAGADGIVRIWTRDGQLVRRFRAHAADVLTLDQSRDGSLLLTVGCDREPEHQSCAARSAKLWTLTGEERASFVHEGGDLTSAAFAPTGARIVTAGEGTLRSWLPSGEPVFNVTGVSHWVSPSSFNSDGTRLVTGGCAPFRVAGMFSPVRPSSACPEASNPAAEIGVYDERGARLSAVAGSLAALDPRGTRIVRAFAECDRTGRCTPILEVSALDQPGRSARRLPLVAATIADIVFSRDGRFFALAFDEGAVTLYDVDGRVVSTLGGIVPGLTSARFSDDGDRLVTVSCSNAHQGACLERSIHVWDPNGPLLKSMPPSGGATPPSRPLDPQATVLRVSPSGAFAFAVTEGESPHIRNVSTGERIELTGVGRVLDAAFDPAETRLATIGEQAIQFRDLGGKLLGQHPPLPRTESPRVPIAAWAGGIVAGTGPLVRAWDWNGKLIGDMKAHSAEVTFITASAQRDTFATVDETGRVIVWDGRFNRTEIDASSTNHPPEGGWRQQRFDTGYKARFTPDATRLVVLGPGNLSLWTRRGEKLWDVAVDPDDDTVPEVSADRVLVVVCNQRGRGASLGSLRMCYDSTAAVWDMKGSLVRRLDAGKAGEVHVEAAAFNPRGNRLVTMNGDGLTRLWDADANLIMDLLVSAQGVAFDEKGGRLITVGTAGSIDIWQVWDDVDAMMAEADRRSVRLQAAKSAVAPR